jgi:hypothetical protein
MIAQIIICSNSSKIHVERLLSQRMATQKIHDQPPREINGRHRPLSHAKKAPVSLPLIYPHSAQTYQFCLITKSRLGRAELFGRRKPDASRVEMATCLVLPYERSMLFCNLCIPPEVTQYFIYKGKRPQLVFTFAFVVLGQGGGYWFLKSVGLDSVILGFWREREHFCEKRHEKTGYTRTKTTMLLLLLWIVLWNIGP